MKMANIDGRPRIALTPRSPSTQHAEAARFGTDCSSLLFSEVLP
jgi:hypothetical protein